MSGRFLKYWLPVIVWMAVIFTASTKAGTEKRSESIVRPPVHFVNPTITEPQFERVHFDLRKAAHVTEYAILAFLLLRAFRAEPVLVKLGFSAQIALVILFAASYAGSDEWHQRFVHTRTPSLRDVLIDTGGVVFGILIFLLFERLRRKKTASEAAPQGLRAR